MAKQKDEKNELAVAGNSALTVMADELAFDAQGASGFENIHPEDVSIPFIKVLQALSPQTRGATKIPGAAEGDFFNTVTEHVYKGTIKLIPCVYQKAFVEWVPREQGGGFVKQYFDSSILSQTKKNEKNMDILPNGNTVVTTAYHYCLLVKEDNSFERVVLSLTSTQLKKSRRWISQMMTIQIAVGNKKITPPMYSHVYEFTTKEESNDFGSWYGFNIGSCKMIEDKDLYLEAKRFYNDITAGIVKTVEPPEHETIAKPDVSTSDIADKF
jgi:hypothetical protein